MIYQLSNELKEINSTNINENELVVGYISKDELIKMNLDFGFDDSTVNICCKGNSKYRSVVETYDEYTFGILHIIGDMESDDDWIAIYIKKNLFIVVDLLDKDKSTENIFKATIEKFQNKKVSLEKIILTFFEQLTSGDVDIIEDIGTNLSELESSLLNKDVDKDFNTSILGLKKYLQRLHYYYEHLLDMVQVIYENDNEIFDKDNMIHISNLIHRLERLNEDTISINSSLEHLQDAYFSYLDMRLNSTMKILTVLTTIFFPLTIIVGWYGMNFKSMPEFNWPFGYAYVIILSVVVSIILIIIGKKGKWFK